jgi:hypothetical protein
MDTQKSDECKTYPDDSQAYEHLSKTSIPVIGESLSLVSLATDNGKGGMVGISFKTKEGRVFYQVSADGLREAVDELLPKKPKAERPRFVSVEPEVKKRKEKKK